MTLFICQDHWQLYLNKVPSHVRRATQELVKRSKSVVISQKEACQVCAGEIMRDGEPYYLCEKHLRAFYLGLAKREGMVRLKDPSFTLQFISWDDGHPILDKQGKPIECLQCSTGSPPPF